MINTVEVHALLHDYIVLLLNDDPFLDSWFDRLQINKLLLSRPFDDSTN